MQSVYLRSSSPLLVPRKPYLQGCSGDITNHPATETRGIDREILEQLYDTNIANHPATETRGLVRRGENGYICDPFRGYGTAG